MPGRSLTIDGMNCGWRYVICYEEPCGKGAVSVGAFEDRFEYLFLMHGKLFVSFAQQGAMAARCITSIDLAGDCGR